MSLFSYASDWHFVARFRAGVGPVPAPKPCRDGSILGLLTLLGWIPIVLTGPSSPDSSVYGHQKASSLVYASSTKRVASNRPWPFLGTVFFFDRGLMMLIAEALSCVFKCAA